MEHLIFKGFTTENTYNLHNYYSVVEVFTPVVHNILLLPLKNAHLSSFLYILTIYLSLDWSLQSA